MTESEYKAFFTRLLEKFGGSFDAPSGWGGDGKILHFSCTLPPIDVPIAEALSPEQRRVIVERARAQYKID
jgi:hypothetical protein